MLPQMSFYKNSGVTIYFIPLILHFLSNSPRFISAFAHSPPVSFSIIMYCIQKVEINVSVQCYIKYGNLNLAALDK